VRGTGSPGRPRPGAVDRAGLYVHVPFCLTRCGYCDFNAYAGLGHLAGRYVRALRREADLAAPGWRDVEFVSMFFGGGTPTTLPAGDLAALVSWFRERFRVTPGAEVTVEANPDTVDEASLSALREAGVTRLSIGVQSFDPAVLAALERVHSAEAARAAYRAARRAGFGDVNLDLIYGAHGETMESWRRTLEQAVLLGPDHLSCYALTVEPATPLGRKVRLGLLPPPDPDLQAEMYLLACDLLAEAGYEHYEVSNWARPGHRCLHNLGYWEGRPYLGLGAGAHSFRGAARWWNVRPPERYLELVEAGRLPVGGSESLGEEDRRLERLLLGLRVVNGVPLEWVPAAEVDRFVAEGLAKVGAGRLALTDRGMLLANEVILALAG
jgi:putative oxygen-independent coproporphyrinogen III oxidase